MLDDIMSPSAWATGGTALMDIWRSEFTGGFDAMRLGGPFQLWPWIHLYRAGTLGERCCGQGTRTRIAKVLIVLGRFQVVEGVLFVHKKPW